MPLFGKDNSFFELMEAQAAVANRAAQTLRQQIGDLAHADDYARSIKDIEHEGDQLTHKVFNKTDSTFVTPLDKEDLHALSGALDDIADFIEATAARVALYKLSSARADVGPLVDLLAQAIQAVQEAVGGLRDMSKHEAFAAVFVRIHEIEDQSDALFRQALADLLNAPDADPLNVIKWKEIYDRIEKAVDKCENVANVIEGVVIKYA